MNKGVGGGGERVWGGEQEKDFLFLGGAESQKGGKPGPNTNQKGGKNFPSRQAMSGLCSSKETLNHSKKPRGKRKDVTDNLR